MPLSRMPESSFQSLAARDRREALRAAQEASGLRTFLLEKDIWVVQTLRVLFDLPFGADIVFKGGTSLAKAYQAIHRFSEDIDVTYDIRAFTPDLVTGAGAEALPRNAKPGATLEQCHPLASRRMGPGRMPPGGWRGPWACGLFSRGPRLRRSAARSL